MIIARTPEEAAGFGPSALTIGKFDGVHAGHRRLLAEVIAQARERGLRPCVLTFDPHPVCVIAPDRAPKPLISLDERCALMGELGIERVFVLRFTPEIARLSPEEFVSRFVQGTMQARVVVVGENFRFGHAQAGDPRVLAALGEQHGFQVRVVAAVARRGLPVSTSQIRNLIDAGEVSKACRLLERPYALTGEVVRGHGIGSRQTVPTLNLRPASEVLPRRGVYITRTDGLDGRRWNSITNIGTRPTFNGEDLTIETFLLDPFQGEPPARIRVEFLRRVREERKFANPEALKAQILRDVARAQAYFRRLARQTAGKLT